MAQKQWPFIAEILCVLALISPRPTDAGICYDLDFTSYATIWRNDVETKERAKPLRFARATPAQFVEAVASVKDKPSVKPRSISEYETMLANGGQLFLAKNHNVGFGITPEHELISLFNSSRVKGLGAKAVRASISRGARFLRCIDDTFLREYYARLGFQVMTTYPMDPSRPGFNNWTDETRPAMLIMTWFPKGQRSSPSEASPSLNKN